MIFVADAEVVGEDRRVLEASLVVVAVIGALAAYVAEHALAVPGPIREYYLTNLAESPDRERWRTRIGWPIFQTAP